MITFLPVLDWKFGEPIRDCLDAMHMELFDLHEPSENCHSFKTSFTLNCVKERPVSRSGKYSMY